MFRSAILILLLLASQSLAANKYVRWSDGDDADDGSTWALAKKTLAGAFTAASAGDTIYVSDNHAETQASAMTLTSPGTAASPCRVLCVDDSAEPPTALAATATATTTGSNAITFTGNAYYYGITFTAGSTGGSGCVMFGSASAGYLKFDNCELATGVNGGAPISIGNNGGNTLNQLIELVNTDLRFGGASATCGVSSGKLIMRGGSLLGTAPTVFLTISNFGTVGSALFEGCDLSLCDSGETLVSVAGTRSIDANFLKCKLGSSVGITTGTHPGQGGATVRLVNCDSADTNYRYQKTNYQGTITQESTIVRTSGATDGTTPISRKMVTTANSKYFSPLESDPILFWNETTGSNVTVTVPVITDNVTLTDAEAWVEVEYLGTSGFPIASTSSDRSTDILASASNQTTDATSTWTTTGLTTPVKQELSVTFTPQEKGVIRARVMLAKASTTMYFDPEILTTSGRTYMVGADGQANEGATGSNTINPLSETIPGL